MITLNKKRISNLILLISTLLLFGGFFYFESYKFTEGAQVKAPARIPASVSSVLDSRVPTLILFAHPKCTCTEATLVELAKLKKELGTRIAVKVYISYDQQDYNEDHEKIENEARRIPHVTVEKDMDRVVAGQFGALTSGQTVLYAPEGNLLYQGGITGSRGHVGDNPGVREITRIVTSPFIIVDSRERLPTFGCHL